MIKKQSGWISFPDHNLDGFYDNSAICHWKLLPEENKRMEIDVLYVHLPQTKNCWGDKLVVRRIFYFILSGEIMENISVIKVVSIYSEMIWYHFTVD